MKFNFKVIKLFLLKYSANLYFSNNNITSLKFVALKFLTLESVLSTTTSFVKQYTNHVLVLHTKFSLVVLILTPLPWNHDLSGGSFASLAHKERDPNP